MMRSMYQKLPDTKMYPAEIVKDAIGTLNQAKDLILRLSSNYSVALELISANAIEHRLDECVICDRGMDAMCGLEDLKRYLEVELEEMEG